MPAKTYPLSITNCSEDHDCLMSKGHHDAAAFKAAAEKHWCEPLKGFEPPKHSWWRAVPDRSGEYHCRYVPVDGPAPGAFPVTYVERY